MPAPSPLKPPDPIAAAHLNLRRALGWLGFALPTALIVVPLALGLDTRAYQSSLSAHYFAPNVGALFVGVLWAIGVFLVSYRGYPAGPTAYRAPFLRNAAGDWLLARLTDARATTLAGLGALGTATVPTQVTPACDVVLCSQPLHLAFAALFFVAAAWIVLGLFTLSDTPRPDWPAEKVRHNRIYDTCGAVMVACLVLIVAEALGTRLPLLGAHPVYWLEAAAIWAFACAWLTKGQALAPLAEGLRRMGGGTA